MPLSRCWGPGQERRGEVDLESLAGVYLGEVKTRVFTSPWVLFLFSLLRVLVLSIVLPSHVLIIRQWQPPEVDPARLMDPVGSAIAQWQPVSSKMTAFPSFGKVPSYS